MATATNTAKHDIEMKVDNGRISYAPDGPSTHVRRGDPINWTAGRAFAVIFGDRTPLESSSLAGGPGRPATGTIRQDAEPGHYKYSAAIFFGGDDVPVVDDPELIVD